MADPTKVPHQPEPQNAPGPSTVNPKNSLLFGKRRYYPLAWVVGMVILLFVIWAFFFKEHVKPVVEPVMQPAVSSTATR